MKELQVNSLRKSVYTNSFPFDHPPSQVCAEEQYATSHTSIVVGSTM